MEIKYRDILNLALSAKDINDKKTYLEKEWATVDQDKLFDFAKIDEVTSHIAIILKASDLKYDPKWDKEYEEVENRTTVLMDVLECVATKLKDNSIEIVALKNAGITKAIFKNNASSPMGDLDLLVRSNEFTRAHAIIEQELGFTFKFRSESEEEDLEEAFRGGGTEYFKMVDGFKVLKSLFLQF